MIGRQALSSIRDVFRETSHGTTSYFRRRANRALLSPVDPRDCTILDALERDGGYSTSLDALGAQGSADMLAAADHLFKEMEQLSPKSAPKDYTISAPKSVVTKYPNVIRWGLNERFLSLAENYIGLPVTYRGVQARLDMPDGTIRETRLWHLDQEDRRILKIVVYGSDVDDDGGPLEYVRADISQPRRLARGSKKRILDEKVFDQVVPAQYRVAVLGPRGTVGIVDTCRVFHRGRLPVSGIRKTLFFAYNSRWPTRPTHCSPLFLVDAFKNATGNLTPRQTAAIEFGYA
jgi:hypothetical protein